ncbi:gephyrin-like molybdotransferase Glp [Sporomusa acidovorans]|uniref:Molybdopterin molybdenumtransferase n=1 Tax=Sporomusa acidovorans (strain ATCC 49682 / DSM 3132 / Mol) TaxID=1123286 RepID=A0ABZ3IZ19_SPOA4|nr:gephyrin-like molybdotransferase Glp [Sporomusa acidovorans]OZC14187.1 molybdopterin molybdenumtransferase [Sporomusa acidovorans DSM 3132]SDE70745.1 molybdopterin molybdotransferase [Sporomusa acidovorans]
MKTGIPLEEAQTTLLELVRPVKECHVSLAEAVGRLLSQDIRTAINLPPFDKSPLDGYALQAGDTETASSENPAILQVIEEVRAGFVPEKQVTPGTAIKVMTGAPLPAGADVIIKFEDVARTGNQLKVMYPLQAGSNIIRAGEDVRQGELIAAKGTVLTPPLVGLLAGIGVAAVPVFSKAKVAILSTGDEVIDPSEKLRPGKIYNSNLHSLGACCSQLGAAPVMMGVVPDEQAAIVEHISRALALSDLVITTGGVSVGDYDIVPAALKQIGAEIIFWKVDMKPGSPIIAAQYNNKLIIGLSGNPAAAFITFDLIVAPLIKRMLGFESGLPPKISAILKDNFNKSSQQRRFLRAKVEIINNIRYAKLTGEQSNGVLKSMIDCNILIDVPAGNGPLVAGQEVSAVVIGRQ